MRVLLLKDVYKLGRAGDVKRVADGFGRNYLLPRGLAVKATSGALKMADQIRKKAETERAQLNQELGVLAERLGGLKLTFSAKAGETGRLYGSITTMMIADAIKAESGFEVDRRQIDTEPIKSLGVHTASIRLTIDLVPEVTLLVHREGEPPESAYLFVEEAEYEEEDFADLQAELEREAEAEREAEEEEEADLEPDDVEPVEETPEGED